MLIKTPEGEMFGFRYDIEYSYAEDLMDFCSKRFPIATLNKYLREEITGLKENDLILDKESSIKLITGIGIMGIAILLIDAIFSFEIKSLLE